MKQKKGFTLIELLAVIVILAIIALIASPIVVGLIENTKENSAELGANGYLDAFDQIVSKSILNRVGFSNGTYAVNDDFLTQHPVLVDGEAPTAGDITVVDNKVTAARLCVTDRSVNYDGSDFSKETTLNYCNSSVTFQDNITNPIYETHTTGEAIYFNAVSNSFCTQSDYTANTTASNTGNKAGCMKWYVISVNDTSSIPTFNIMLDHHITTSGTSFSWHHGISDAGQVSNYGPKDLLDRLKADIATWTTSMTWKTVDAAYSGREAGASYGYEKLYITNNTATLLPTGSSQYTVTALKARTITAEEIAAIVGNTTWNKIGSNITLTSYGWLFDRTGTTCVASGCSNNSDVATSGYWTLTPRSNTVGSNIWVVTSSGTLTTTAFSSTAYGIRPVVEIKKKYA